MKTRKRRKRRGGGKTKKSPTKKSSKKSPTRKTSRRKTHILSKKPPRRYPRTMTIKVHRMDSIKEPKLVTIEKLTPRKLINKPRPLVIPPRRLDGADRLIKLPKTRRGGRRRRRRRTKRRRKR
jgi:hypothetical protein